MGLKISDKSLFAYLLRAPWWFSFIIAFGLGGLARLAVPDTYALYAFSVGVPFAVIGLIAAWKQRRIPSRGKVEATVEAVAAMSWRDFSALLEQSFKRDGYEVTRGEGGVDFRLRKGGRLSLVCGKRWKAANHGVEPLRELVERRRAEEAREAIYIALGEMSDSALEYAQTHRVVLMQGLELAVLLRLPRKQGQRSP